MTDLESLVGRLSEAQRASISRAHPGERQMAGFGVIWDERGNMREPALVEPVGLNHPIFGSHYRLTELGQQVRAHLKSKDNG